METVFGGTLPAWVDTWVRLPAWGIFYQPLGFMLFLTTIMAENKRPPFDTPEGESEIIAGYFLEYSGMRFGLFFMSEFIEVLVIAGLVATLFLGGWSIPWVSTDAMLIGRDRALVRRGLRHRRLRAGALPRLHGEGGIHDLAADGAALDAAAFPLRPGDGPVLEDHPAALDREHLRDRLLPPAPEGGASVTAPVVLFYAFAVLAVVSALAMVLNVRNTVAAAMSLVVTMVSLAGIYVLLEAHLVAVDPDHGVRRAPSWCSSCSS